MADKADLAPFFRAERLAYDADPRRAIYPYRLTAGGRVQLLPRLTAQVNVIRQHGVPEQGETALDVALTYVVRFAATRTH